MGFALLAFAGCDRESWKNEVWSGLGENGGWFGWHGGLQCVEDVKGDYSVGRLFCAID